MQNSICLFRWRRLSARWSWACSVGSGNSSLGASITATIASVAITLIASLVILRMFRPDIPSMARFIRKLLVATTSSKWASSLTRWPRQWWSWSGYPSFRLWCTSTPLATCRKIRLQPLLQITFISLFVLDVDARDERVSIVGPLKSIGLLDLITGWI